MSSASLRTLREIKNIFIDKNPDLYRKEIDVTKNIFMQLNDHLDIVEYTPAYSHAFKKINEQWIKAAFEMEETDEQVLSNPEKYILQDGGCILIALYKGEAAGTCALINEGNHIYELTKMAVTPALRGLKIGYHLGAAILDKAKSLHAKKVILFSNRRNSAKAIELYKQLGFTEIPLENAPWKRADIKMEIQVS